MKIPDVIQALLLVQIPAAFLFTAVLAQSDSSSVVVAGYNVSAPTGSRVVLQCVSGRMVWTRDSLKDRQRVVHWDLYRPGPDYAMERVADMFSAGDQRIYNGHNQGRVSLSQSAFNDGNFSLVIRDIAISDRGLYSCNLHHHYCHLYETIRIQVNVTKLRRKEQRFWDGQKAVFVVLVGSTVVLPCVNRRSVWTEDGSEEEQQVVHWDRQPPGVRHDRADRLIDLYASGEQRSYGPLFLQRKMNISAKSFSQGDFSLAISALQPGDQGLYTCHLHHHYCGLHERRQFQLTVGPPEPRATVAPRALPNQDKEDSKAEASRVINFILPDQRHHFLLPLGYILTTLLLLAFIVLTSQWERRFPLSPTIGKHNSSRSVPDLAPFPTTTTTTTTTQQQLQSSAPARQLQPNRSSVFLTERNSSQVISNGNSSSQVAVKGNKVQKRNSQLIGTRQTKSSGQITSSQGRIERAPSNLSMAESKISGIKSKGEAGINGNGQIADITMKEAVEYLSSGDENYQLCGASFIQHATYSEDKAKQEVLRLKGIPPLVNLLRSPSPQVQQTASAALRNLAFKDADNKEVVQRCGGITEALALLRDTDSTETQKQLTGLLWNLSSADSLKPELVRSALPVLTETVVVPYTGDETNNNQDPEVFYHATACLRNLSCATQGNRQAMRNCRGLVDSLVSYVQRCVAAERPDDKSVENCVCVLHNLSFQLESEAPALFSRITALARTPSRANTPSETGPIGCFSPQSSKVQEQESHFDYPVIEEQNPKGAGWLFHSKTMQSYLSLLGSSQREETLEACSGALQNLTANNGIVSSVISQSIVQKLNGLPHISPLLQSSNPSLQKTAVSLVGNLAKNQRLQSTMARQTLPELVGILSSWTKEETPCDDTLAMVCQTSHSLLMKEPELGKPLLTNKLVNSVNNLSKNRDFPKASKAAAVLLYSLWSEKDVQSFLKKQGMNKGSFVNDITSAAHRSVQVIE